MSGGKTAVEQQNNVRQSFTCWQAVFDALPDLISVQDREFRIIMANKAFLTSFGQTREQIIGKTCCEFLHGDPGHWAGCPHRLLLQNKQFITEEFFDPHRGVFQQVNCIPVVNEEEIIGTIRVARNISDQKNKEYHLLEKETVLNLEIRERTRELEDVNIQLRVEIEKHRIFQKQLEERLKFKKLLASISTRFIATPSVSIDSEIEAAQKEICDCLGLDISLLWQSWSGLPGTLFLRHVTMPPDYPFKFPVQLEARESFPWALEMMLKREPVILFRITDAPPEAARDVAAAQHLGYKSVAVLPLYVGDGPSFGALSFVALREEREWTEELINNLQIVTQIFANALNRKFIEDEVRESEARLNLAADSANAGLWSWDYKSGIIWVTDRTRLLYAFPRDGEITAATFFNALHPDDLERIRLVAERGFHDGGVVQTEYRIVLPDQSVRWILVRAQGVLGPSGEPDRMTGVSLDITSQKQAEVQLAQMRLELAHLGRVTAMNELSTSLAHEINQPLGAILNNAQAGQLLWREDKSCNDVEEILSDIIQDARRAGDVVRRIRGLVKRGEVRLEPLAMNALIEDIIKLYLPRLRINNVLLRLELQPDLADVNGDCVQLQQVLLNLIANAIESMQGKARSTLLIRSSMAGRRVIVSVCDTGKGIGTAQKEHLFKPFFTTKKEGLGMGLSICRSIIAEHGGKIWAEDNPEAGATFSFALKSAGKGAA